MFQRADLSQITYYSVILCGVYYITLSLVWLKGKKWKADKFFYYIFFAILAITTSHLGSSIARYYMLVGDISGNK